jgi:hypothetical protein
MRPPAVSDVSQLDRLQRMHAGQKTVFTMIEKQREEMLTQIRETKRLIEIEETKSIG